MRLESPEKHNLRFHEVASILKCASNKKMILPQPQMSSLTNRLIDLSQEYIVQRYGGKEDLELVELMYVMNCYRRYDYPENLSEGFVSVTKTLIE